MKKTKIQQRIKNAANAFFENEPKSFGKDSLSFVRDSAVVETETGARFNRQADVLMKILKRGFLFFPGALYLFFGTFSILTFDFLWNPLTVLGVFLIGSFMTIFGLGSLKNPKHLVIPLSIVAVAITAFSFFSIIGSSKYVFEYGIYFFPLALVAPFPAKNLADSSDRTKKSGPDV